MKRFWTEVSIGVRGDGFAVFLDGRPVKTPAKTSLSAPSEALAQAIADEWAAQEGEVRPEGMPYTRMANAALDKVTPQRAEVATMLADYGGTDLLCYRAEGPDALVARQAAQWDPYLEWAATAFGARLHLQTGLMPVPQEAAALEALKAQVDALDPFRLSAFHDLVALTGSLGWLVTVLSLLACGSVTVRTLK